MLMNIKLTMWESNTSIEMHTCVCIGMYNIIHAIDYAFNEQTHT